MGETDERMARNASGSPADERPLLDAYPVIRSDNPLRRPLQGILALSASDAAALNAMVEDTLAKVANGWAPDRRLPEAADVAGAERIVVDFADRKELEDRLAKARKAIGLGTPAAWKPLTSQGIFRGSGPEAGQDRVPLSRARQPDA